jgi:outer membrane receptor protein involved in Fe transport
VVVTAGRTATVEPEVDWTVSYVDTITVYSASRQTERITEAPAAITVISEEQIAREGNSGQVPKLLEFTPGAEVTQSGLYDFNFNARGFNSSLNRRILTLIDGRDPSVPFLGSQEWAAVSFPLDDLASLELVRGPGSALYGADAFNGVLNMVTKAPRFSQGGKVQATGGDLSHQAARLPLPPASSAAASTPRRPAAIRRARTSRSPATWPAAVPSTGLCGVGPPRLPRSGSRCRCPDRNEIAYGGVRLDKHFATTPTC